MYQLSPQEVTNLKSQFVISSWGGRRHRPYAFTEQGVAMLSSVLRSERAVRVNVEIMRAFVRLRKLLVSHADLARKLDELEKKYDSQFRVVFDAIGELMAPTVVPKGRRVRERRDVMVRPTDFLLTRMYRCAYASCCGGGVGWAEVGREPSEARHWLRGSGIDPL
jgi:hypothetical protein